MARSSNSLSKTFVWILLGLLIVGLAGFGASGLGGGVKSIGKVGEIEIPVQQYFRALESEINAASAQINTQLTFQQAMMFGVQQQALGRIVVEKTLENEASILKISVSDSTLRDELMDIQAFQAIDGSFDRTTYSFTLENIGMSEVEFEEQLRSETASRLIKTAIIKGIEMPSIFSQKALEYLSEERKIVVLEIDENDLPQPIIAATEEELLIFYEENKELFSLPESKSITYAILTPEMLSDDIDILEDDLRSLYEKNFDDFNRPERRIVERLNFIDIDDAQAASNRIENGEINFAGLVRERGLSISDTDIGEVTIKELGELGEAVFSLAEGETSKPLESELGAAIFRINGILNAKVVPFEEVREKLKLEISLEKAKLKIDREKSRINDLLAAGATLEELTAESRMELENTIYYEGVESKISSYTAFQSAAQQVRAENFPEVIQLADGGILAMRLDASLPERIQDYRAVKENVVLAWQSNATMKALQARGKKIISEVESGTKLATFGNKYQEFTSLRRDSSVPSIPTVVISRSFELDKDEVSQIVAENRMFVLKVVSVEDGDTSALNAVTSREQFADQLNQNLASDVFQIYLQEIQKEAGISLNEQALEAVHASFQ